MDHILIGKKKSFCFRIIADFEADNEIDKSSIGSKTSIIYKQNPVCSGYFKLSELNDILQTVYCDSPLRYNNVG